MLKNLVSQLGRELSMEELIKNTENKRYLLPFDEDIEVEAVELEKKYLLKGVVGKVPKQNAEAFFLQVMEANLFGMGTRGSALGLDEDGKVLTLSLEVDYNNSFKDFKEKLEDFVSVIDFWRSVAVKHQ